MFSFAGLYPERIKAYVNPSETTINIIKERLKANPETNNEIEIEINYLKEVMNGFRRKYYFKIT